MSILIRKECQEVLDSANLNLLHVGIQKKYLTLVGPCGQPIVVISGIKFSTNNPNKTEVAYACILFTKFLEEHKADIVAYIKAKKIFNTLDKPEYEGKLLELQQYSDYYFLVVATIKYSFYPSGKICVHTGILDELDFDSIYKTYEELSTDFAPFLKAITAYRKVEKDLNTLKTKIASCDI